jgi:hypothetical protein
MSLDSLRCKWSICRWLSLVLSAGPQSIGVPLFLVQDICAPGLARVTLEREKRSFAGSRFA